MEVRVGEDVSDERRVLRGKSREVPAIVYPERTIQGGHSLLQKEDNGTQQRETQDYRSPDDEAPQELVTDSLPGTASGGNIVTEIQP